jgi:hypothetical protein
MRRTKTITWLSLFGIIGLVGYGRAANAAIDEYSIILLDRTGSMSTVTNATAVPPTTRWTDAIDAAISLVWSDSADPSVDRAYAVWDFRIGAGTVGGPTNDPSQVNAAQVWPTQASDCTSISAAFYSASSSVTGVTNNFCDFKTGNSAVYSSLVSLLGTYKTDPDRTPDANGNGRTPLADSLCRVLDQMAFTNTAAKQTITFESDGLENQSSATGVCGNFAVDSTASDFVNNPNFVWQKSLQDWGMTGTGADALPAGSWEARIVRRAMRLNIPTAAMAVTNKPLLVSDSTAATDLAWRVGVHYQTFNSSSTSPLALSASPSALTIGSSGTTRDDSTQRFAVNALLAGLAAPGTAAAASTVTISIPQSELSLFRSLGSPSFPSKGTGTSR